MPQQIYLIRHATPDWTRKDIPYHLPPGPPLIEQGLAEAQALAAFLLSELGAEVPPLRIFDHRNVLPPAGAWLAAREDGSGPWELRLVFKPDLTPA